MLTAHATLDALARYDITENDLRNWEQALGLQLPVDAEGRPVFSAHHINLFKNVKKHLALGRTLEQIKSIINLPPDAEARVQTSAPVQEKAILQEKDPSAQRQDIPAGQQAAAPQQPTKTVLKTRTIIKSPYASLPQTPQRNGAGAADVVDLVKKLTDEKDHLYQKLLETEKLNSHMYSANNLYHRRVKDLEQSLDSLRKELPFDENVKLMDDKAKLHKQVLEAEKKATEADKQTAERELELRQAQHAILDLNQAMNRLNQRLSDVHKPFDASVFCGDWMEDGQLIEIVYDNFGVNIEPQRTRLFRVSKTPDRVYGNTAIISTHYQYESNAQWRREESLVATYSPLEQTLEGEVTAEYILDGVPVAKAIYTVTCRRHS